MTSGKIILTRDGYEKLKGELDYLVSKKRVEIARDLGRARAFGDLRENAEYEAAKHAQELNEKRIAELGERLSRTQILDDHEAPKGKVTIGAKVALKDVKSGETVDYMLVSPDEADYKQNKLSIASPVGKALLGRKINQVVTIRVPAGDLKYKVLKISR